MTSRERIIRTLRFENPDRLPVHFWTLPATYLRYPDLDEQLSSVAQDIASVVSFLDMSADPRTYEEGTYVDEWGSRWLVLQPGMVGEVKSPALDDVDLVASYVPPIELFQNGFDQNLPQLEAQIRALREKDLFINGGWISLFERMQFLRGTENLYCDIALDSPEFYTLRDRVMEYFHAYLDKWLQMDVDAIAFGDDWGSQRALLISPAHWRKLFKPCYKELFDRIKAAGKYVFFHSDGYILDIYEDLIEIGVDALNSQLWCMGLENVAPYVGRITFWGEISRQDTLPRGTPEDVRRCAEEMKRVLYRNGGLIGQSEIGPDVPRENIQALIHSWNP